MNLDAWLAGHPYLAGVARWTARVESALTEIQIFAVEAPDWNAYAGDFQEGLPLLKSPSAGVDFEPAGKTAVALVGRLAAASEGLAGISELNRQLHAEGNAVRLVADWLLGDEALTPSSPGLMRYLGWKAAARSLAALVDAYARRRGDETWMKAWCPTCGGGPAMAQLAGRESGRVRLLCCGLCGTSWRYSRTACPFCGHDVQRLQGVAVDGEAGLRIDHCESCAGYLKTYDGTGNETLLLADWTSLHLDFAARDRGLARRAESLYDLDSVAVPQPA